MSSAQHGVATRLPAIGPGEAVAAATGLLTGAFAAWAYYDDTFRSLAHSYGLWIVLLTLLGAGHRPVPAVRRSVLALTMAVVAFFVGKKVMYGVEYPGMPYSVNVGVMVQWLVLAVVAGALLGWVFSLAGSPGHRGGRGTAAVVGLLAADAYRHGHASGDGPSVLLPFALLAIGAVVLWTVRSQEQLISTAVWTVPLALLGLLLVSAPDMLEQLLISGSLSGIVR